MALKQNLLILFAIVVIANEGGALAWESALGGEYTKYYNLLADQYCKSDNVTQICWESSFNKFEQRINGTISLSFIDSALTYHRHWNQTELATQFKTLCGKSEEILLSLSTLLNDIETCCHKNDTKRLHKMVMDTASTFLSDVVCPDKGNNISLFIADNGPECAAEKVTGKCLNDNSNETEQAIYDNAISAERILNPEKSYYEVQVDFAKTPLGKEYCQCYVTLMDTCRRQTALSCPGSSTTPVVNSIWTWFWKSFGCELNPTKKSQS